MSGIAKSVKKVFRKIKENKILKTVVIGAALWFTVGTAMNYYAGPTAGSLGASASAQASSMWSSTVEFFGADAAASGAEGASNTASSLLGESGAQASAIDMSVGESAIPLAEGVGAEAGLSAADGLTLNAPSASAAYAGVPESGIVRGGMMEWLKANPMATMMLGQAGVGAYSGYLNDKESERIAEEKANRGLMGFDSTGKYQGVVRSQLPDPGVEPNGATTAPIVEHQQVAVQRTDLPKLNKQGQILKR